MGLRLLSFLRDWTNPADFPTVEPDEATVRADLQYHPDAIKDYINGTLIPSHDSLTSAKHSHDNKTVLDGITADDVAKWRGTIGTFRVNVTYSNGAYSADKTFAEIKAAYEAGQQPYVVYGGNTIYTLSYCYFASEQMFMDFERYLIGEDTLETETLRIYSYTTDSGSNIVKRTSSFDVPSGTTYVKVDSTDDVISTVNGETYADIQALINAGKLVVVRYDDVLDFYYFETFGFSDSSGIHMRLNFRCVMGSIVYTLTLRDDNTWAFSETSLQSESITDSGGYFTTDTVEGALQEIGAELAGAVKSVNGKTGAVVLDADAVGAQRPLIPGSGISIVWREDGDVIQSDASGGGGLVSFVEEKGGAPIAQFTLNQTEDCEINVNTLTARLGTKVNNLEASLSNNYRTAADQDAIDATKQSIITDLETIRSGASLGATAVQPEAGKGLFSGSYNDLTDKPTIPDISGKQDKLIAGEGITIAADGKTISSSGKVSSVNGKTGTVSIDAEDIIYTKVSQNLGTIIDSLEATDTQMANAISELQTADASLDSRITAIETGDTPVTLYIYWESVVGTGLVSLTRNGAAMSVTDFISKMQSGAKIIIGENNDGDSESSGFSNYRYKITDSTTASLAFDVANSFNGSNRTIIISGSSSTEGLMHGYQDIDHDDLPDYSPLPEGSTPASKAWVENYIDEKAAALQSKSITDSGGHFTSDTVEGALQEIGAELAGINTLLGSGIQISFTISAGDVETFSVVSGTTWAEWIGTGRLIFNDGRMLYIYGGVVATEAGVYAVSLNGSTAVSGSDEIISGATYTIINWGG